MIDEKYKLNHKGIGCCGVIKIKLRECRSMKRTKKIVAMGLAFGLVLSSIPVSVNGFAASNKQKDNRETDVPKQLEEIKKESRENNFAQQEKTKSQKLVQISSQSETVVKSGKAGENPRPGWRGRYLTQRD